MKLSFTTLSCPGCEWAQVLALAKGYAGVELRGLGPDLDHTQNPALREPQVRQTLAQARDAGLEFVCLDTSMSFHDPERKAEHEKEFAANLALAKVLGAPYLRVFGDKLLPDEDYPAAYARVGEGLAALGDQARAAGVKVLLETHGQFAAGRHAKAIMEAADHPAVGVLWDMHHTVKYGHETPAATLDAIRPWLFHVHYKDSLGPWESLGIALPGQGDVPLAETTRLLTQSDYDGYLSFEHEKRWIPGLAEPEIALPAYLAAMGPMLEAL